MSLFTKTRIGQIVKVAKGDLAGKYAMISKEVKDGYGVLTTQEDWPTDIPLEYNALFVRKQDVTDVPYEEASLLKIKFPDPTQFE